MNLSETAKLLGAMSAFDRRTVGDGDVIAWQAVLSDASFDDCLEAVKRHYAENTEWMMPAHIRRLVRDVVREREDAARATPWAAGQYGVLKADAMPEVAGPVDENAITPSVRALLDSVRAMLPEGSREALMPRRVAWEREHAGFRRQEEAVPNPHYRPNPHRAPLADDSGRFVRVCTGESGCSPQSQCGLSGPHWWSFEPTPAATWERDDGLRPGDTGLELHECLIKDGRCLVKGHDGWAAVHPGEVATPDALEESDGFCDGGPHCTHGEHKEDA